MKVINKTMDIIIWPLTAVLVFLALQFISQFVFKTALFMAYGEGQEVPLDIASWSILASSVMTSLLLAFVKPFRLFKEFRIWVCDNWNALVAFIIVVIAMLSATMLNEILEKYLGMNMDDDYKQLFEDVVKTPVGIFALVVAGPVCEEIVFRAGIMKPMLDRNVRPWIPILVSALIFGLVHGNISQMVYATALGTVFAIVYHRTRSLLVTTFTHILNNLIMVSLMVTNDNYEEITVEHYIGTVPLILAFVVSATLIVMLIRVFWKNTEKYQNISCQ